jgi:hypothetical protein
MITKKKNFKNKLSKTRKQNGGFPGLRKLGKLLSRRKTQKYSISQPPPTKPRPESSEPKPFVGYTNSVPHSKAIETGTDLVPTKGSKSVPHSKAIDELKKTIREKLKKLKQNNTINEKLKKSLSRNQSYETYDEQTNHFQELLKHNMDLTKKLENYKPGQSSNNKIESLQAMHTNTSNSTKLTNAAQKQQPEKSNEQAIQIVNTRQSREMPGLNLSGNSHTRESSTNNTPPTPTQKKQHISFSNLIKSGRTQLKPVKSTKNAHEEKKTLLPPPPPPPLPPSLLQNTSNKQTKTLSNELISGISSLKKVNPNPETSANQAKQFLTPEQLAITKRRQAINGPNEDTNTWNSSK